MDGGVCSGEPQPRADKVWEGLGGGDMYAYAPP